MTQTATITIKLKAAEPMMVDGPRSPAKKAPLGLRSVISITESRISGADDPSAIRVRFATVSFHTFAWNFFFSPLTTTVVTFVCAVIVSMEAMNASAPRATPMNTQHSSTIHRKMKVPLRLMSGKIRPDGQQSHEMFAVEAGNFSHVPFTRV